MRKTLEDKKLILIDELKTARRAVLDALADVPPGILDQACIGFWSAKDLAAHLVGWDVTNLQAVQEILANQAPAFLQHFDKDWQSYNAHLVRTYKIEPFNALIAEIQESHRRLVTFLETLPASDLVNGKVQRATGRTVTIRNLLHAEASDERKHAEQLREFCETYHCL